MDPRERDVNITPISFGRASAGAVAAGAIFTTYPNGIALSFTSWKTTRPAPTHRAVAVAAAPRPATAGTEPTP
jgi:hypothetical protein